MTCIQQWWLAPQEIVTGDPLWGKVIMLLRNEPGVGFVDSGPLNLTVETVGTPVLNTAEGQWGAGSLLTSAGNYLRAPDDVRMAFPANDGLTIEIAYWQPGPNVSGTMFHMDLGPAGTSASLGLNIPTFDAIAFSGMGSGVIGAAGTAGSWHRLVMQWDAGGTGRGRVWHDGFRIWNVASGQPQPQYVAGGYIHIGCGLTGASPWPGRLGEFRITAAARYDDTFNGAQWVMTLPTERMPGG